MNIFDEQAVKAAVDVIWSPDHNDKTITEITRAALEAAVASLRERGMLEAFVPSGADCHPDSPHASKFIIRIKKDD